MAITVRTCVLSLVVVATLACGDSATGPTTIGSPAALNLAGTWTGVIGMPQSGNSIRATWTASQTGLSVTGPIALTRPSDNIAFAGTLAGTLSGTRLLLTYTIPRGNVPGFADCSMSGTGSADASTATILGTLTITYTNCQGYISQPSTTESVTLNR